ncbi:ribosomal RNA small subunit methyltransferase A [Clostridium sp. CAG:1219]|nr:ribosomal RNA small subunit methyltransferase A [Clostridium sp. CAG:1219]
MNTFRKTREILNKYGLTAKKKFGQNFLIDDNILDEISTSACINDDELIIEIGPGLGNLTSYLLKKSRYVLLVEIDNNMIEILNDRFKENTNYSLINEDILKVDLDEKISKIEEELSFSFKKVKVVANLPYYITTPILFKLLQDSKRVDEIVVMVQKEVADRMVASPKSKDYGILSVMIKYLADAKIIIKVPKEAFIPSPNVTSSVIKLVKNKKYECDDEEKLFELIHHAFAQRRKKIINSLESSKFLNLDKEKIKDAFNKAKLNENVRAEELSIEEFILLSKEF